MMRICPVVTRTWWKVKTWLFPWVDQTNRPEPKPRMRDADAMLQTAIFNLADVLDDKRRQ